jgi:hypothetical protein
MIVLSTEHLNIMMLSVEHPNITVQYAAHLNVVMLSDEHLNVMLLAAVLPTMCSITNSTITSLRAGRNDSLLLKRCLKM